MHFTNTGVLEKQQNNCRTVQQVSFKPAVVNKKACLTEKILNMIENRRIIKNNDITT